MGPQTTHAATLCGEKMINFNAEQYSDEDLREIGKIVEQELVDRKDRHRREIAQQIRELAATIGMTPDEVLSSEANPKKRSPIAPKYQDPDDLNRTWSGRGRKPTWVLEQLAAGKTMQDLEI